MAVQKQLVVQKQTGARLKGPKKQFVLTSHWNEEKHGKWDPSKETEIEIGGVKKKGVYRLVGEEGVYDLEEYEDTALQEQVLEHGFDENVFSDQGFNKKKEVLQNALASAAKNKDALAVRGPEISVEGLLKLVQETNFSGAGSSKDRPSARPRSRSGHRENSASSSSIDAESSESPSEEAGSSAALALLAPGAVKKGGAKAAAAAPSKNAKGKATQAAQPCSSKQAKPKQQGTGQSRASATDKSTPVEQCKDHKGHKESKDTKKPKVEKPSQEAVMLLDGRATRTLHLASAWRSRLNPSWTLHTWIFTPGSFSCRGQPRILITLQSFKIQEACKPAEAIM